MEELVNKLLDVFRALKKDENGKRRKGVFIGLALSVAMIIIGLLSFRAWKNGKKMAKLLHEKAVAEEKEIQASADALIADSEEKKKAAAAQAEAIRQKILKINEALQETESVYEQSKETIKEIKTWEEFDRFSK
jgi:peptidoglycan hydrolase CwlO-like protein